MLNKKIHLNRALYEFYPFTYFIFGTAFYLLINGHDVLRVISLAACFGAGFIALLIRSKHRSLYKKEKSRLDKKLWLPKPVYELIPVAYISAGFLLIVNTSHLIVFFGGIALFTIGCYFMFSRAMHRVFLSQS